MSFSSSTIWEVENAGVDGNSGNGGGFDPGNASMATDGAATVATSAAPVFTSATYNFAARDVGAWVFIKSGTNWTPGWYQIASVAANAATLSAAIGAGALYKTQGIPTPTTAAGCATVASPTTATWSVDYSQQSGAGITYTDMVIGGTTTQYTSAANPVGPNVVGNVIAVNAGTNFTIQRVQVVSVSGTTATCDKSLGTAAATGGNGILGGALATPGYAGGLHVAGNGIYVKYNAAVFSVTSNTFNIAGGCLNPAGGSGAQKVHLSGYNVVRGDLENVVNFANMPTIQTNNVAGNASGVVSTGTYTRVANLILDGSAGATKAGRLLQLGQYSQAENCKINVFTGIGLYPSIGGCSVRRCWITGGTSAATAGIHDVNGSFIDSCYVNANACPGITLGGGTGATVVRTISSSNTTAAGHGFQMTSTYGGTIYACDSYNNAGDGININGANSGDAASIRNCILTKNTGYGINNVGGTNLNFYDIDYNYFANNVTGNYHNVGGGTHDILSTADPYTNAASGDFSLNNNNPGGAQCRNAGFPGAFPNGAPTTGYASLGATELNQPVTVPTVWLLHP